MGICVVSFSSRAGGNCSQIGKLIRSAEIHFLELVQKSAGRENRNRYVARCKQMIHDRLHQKISAQE